MHQKYYILLLFTFLGFTTPAQNSNFEQVLDSIQLLRKLSDDTSFSLDTRLDYAKKASELAYKTEVDSVILRSNEALSKALWDYKSFDEYRKLNKKNLALAIKVKDSFAIGQTHLNLGDYYRKKTHYGDSAFHHFYNAEKTYKSLKKNKIKIAEALYGIAIIQTFEKDYIQSEITSFNAISLLKAIRINDENNKLQSFFYNNLGLIYNELCLFDQSIDYYSTSLKIKKSIKRNSYSICITLNNIGYVYKRMGKYKLAINYFNQILNNNYIRNKHQWIYIMALESYSHTLFLSKQYDKLPYLYHKVLKVADTSNVEYETIIAHQHLAEYYHHFK